VSQTYGGNNQAIQVEALSKHYGDLRALDNVSFDVPRGTVIALLGPNGAGKTTLVRMLSTLIAPTSGTAQVEGYDIRRHPRQVRQCLGVAFTDTSLYARLTVRETLRYFGRLYQIAPGTLESRIEELVSLFDMNSYAERPVAQLSRGMQRKVVIARAILHAPPVLIMDEPTTGLDIQASAEMIDFIRTYARAGKTILLVTHNLTEVEMLCDDILILRHGRIAEGPTPVRGLSSSELQATIFRHINGSQGKAENRESEGAI